MPDLMGEDAISADGKDFHSQRFEFIVLDGNRRQFRRSDESEISGVEAEHHAQFSDPPRDIVYPRVGAAGD